MQNETSYRDLSTEQLRTEINQHLRQEQASLDPLPLPAAANRAALTPEQQETAFENWVAYIYARPTQTWTPEEVAAIRAATVRALRTL
jgi:hypothetical protein